MPNNLALILEIRYFFTSSQIPRGPCSPMNKFSTAMSNPPPITVPTLKKKKNKHKKREKEKEKESELEDSESVFYAESLPNTSVIFFVLYQFINRIHKNDFKGIFKGGKEKLLYSSNTRLVRKSIRYLVKSVGIILSIMKTLVVETFLSLREM